MEFTEKPDWVKLENGKVKMVPLSAFQLTEPNDGGKTYNFSVIKSDDGTIFPFEPLKSL